MDIIKKEDLFKVIIKEKKEEKRMTRIGVFVCHCGRNIAQTVGIDRVVNIIREHPDVVFCESNPYMCSDPGQNMVKDAINEYNLDRVVVAACSRDMHEDTFRAAAVDAGLNKYLVEMANIREQCSWVTSDVEEATSKAIRIIRSAIEQISKAEPLTPIKIPVERKALVIGGGVAGIQAALDIADSGYKVTLVEKDSTIGGKMAQLAETFPTLDCSQCILTPKMVAVNRHPNITLLTNSEVEEVGGYVGNFKVKIKKKPRYVIEDECTICDDCVDVCPAIVESEYNEGFSKRKAIYLKFPQAVPAAHIVDPEHCIGLDSVPIKRLFTGDVIVDESKCPERCEECVWSCPINVIERDGKHVRIDTEVCVLCGACATACPEDAITVKRNRILVDQDTGFSAAWTSVVSEFLGQKRVNLAENARSMKKIREFVNKIPELKDYKSDAQ